jgi:hypothetical protein
MKAGGDRIVRHHARRDRPDRFPASSLPIAALLDGLDALPADGWKIIHTSSTFVISGGGER